MTFLSLDQPRVLLLSVAFGLYLGVCYFPFCLMGKFFKREWVKHILIALWIALGAFPFSMYGKIMNFPNFSGYMIIGVLVGLWLYAVSLHKLVAILALRVYNGLNKLIKRLLKALKGKNERRKKKTSVLGKSFRVNNALHGASFCVSVSNGGHFGKKK